VDPAYYGISLVANRMISKQIGRHLLYTAGPEWG